MNAYKPISWKKKFAFAAATPAMVAAALEIVAGSMTFPDPNTMAVREQVIAAQSERAQQIRELARGEVRIADTATGGRI